MKKIIVFMAFSLLMSLSVFGQAAAQTNKDEETIKRLEKD